jgi:hypothetical protein
MAVKRKLKTDFIRAFGAPQPPVLLNTQEFRFVALRPEGNVRIDDMLESAEWRDEGANEIDINAIPTLRGTVGLRDSDSNDVRLRDGNRVRCYVRWFGIWKPLWEMRVQGEESNVEEGVLSYELSDDLMLAALTSISKRYRKGKKTRTRGWRYDEIVRDLCRIYKLPIGSMPRGTKRFSKTFDEVPLIEAIRSTVEEEVKWSGVRLVMKWAPDKTGRYALHVVPMRRNPLLYLFKDQIRTALVRHQRRGTLATAIVPTGYMKHGKKREKVKLKAVVSKKGVQRYGYIEREQKYAYRVESKRELRLRAQRSLARSMRPVRLLENFTHPGIASLRRGDAIRVSIPSEGYIGAQGIVFVIGVTHTLSAGDYTMTMTLGLHDPMDPNKIRAEREAALRARKRAARKKKEAAHAA